MTLSPLASTLVSLAVIAVFALLLGGWRIIARGDRQRGILMIVAALVLLGNILILTL